MIQLSLALEKRSSVISVSISHKKISDKKINPKTISNIK